MRRILLALTLAMVAPLPAVHSPAQAQQSVKIEDKEAFLHVSLGARASAVLVPGKGGIDPADPLLRNCAAPNARGIATLTVPHFTGADAEVVDGIVRFVIR